MNKYLIILAIALLCNCATKNEDQTKLELASNSIEVDLLNNFEITDYSVFDKPDIHKALYTVKFRTNSIDNNLHNLIIDMRLNDGGHFVSPNAKRDFSGKFTVIMDDNDTFELIGDLIESPLSVEEIDLHPFVNGPINWVKENTTYTQQIKLNVTNDFEVKGYIQFTIEPACTLEKVPFIIKQNDGDLVFELFGC